MNKTNREKNVNIKIFAFLMAKAMISASMCMIFGLGFMFLMVLVGHNPVAGMVVGMFMSGLISQYFFGFK